MKYALIENGKVIQTSCKNRDGYIPCPDYVCPGYEYTNNEWLRPEIVKSKSELALSKISQLESQQTPRRLREAALGNADSIAFLQDVDDQISVLRESL